MSASAILTMMPSTKTKEVRINNFLHIIILLQRPNMNGYLKCKNLQSAPRIMTPPLSKNYKGSRGTKSKDPRPFGATLRASFLSLKVGPCDPDITLLQYIPNPLPCRQGKLPDYELGQYLSYDPYETPHIRYDKHESVINS